MNAAGTVWPIERQLTAYWCMVAAEGPIYGLGLEGRAVLGEEQVLTSKLALRWLCHQALWIADGLDPAPETWQVDRAYVKATDPVGDVPTELRVWAEDDAVQQLAREELAAIGRVRLEVRDASGSYWLTAQRIAQPSPPVPPAAPAGTDLHRPRHRGPGRRGRLRRAPTGCGP